MRSWRKGLSFAFSLFGGSVGFGAWTNCAGAELQLRSYPAGAVLIETDTGKRYRAPINLSYNLSEGDRDASGCHVVKGFQAVWGSGAHVESPKLISLCGTGPIWNYRFERPGTFPRLDVDVAIENRLKQQAQSAASLQYMLGAFLSGFAGGGRNTYVPPPIDGSSTMPNVNGSQSGGSSLPQITPDGSYVSGSKPYSICPNVRYVSGNCTLAPDGSYVGQ